LKGSKQDFVSAHFLIERSEEAPTKKYSAGIKSLKPEKVRTAFHSESEKDEVKLLMRNCEVSLKIEGSLVFFVVNSQSHSLTVSSIVD
jgi:hypothetical protein